MCCVSSCGRLDEVSERSGRRSGLAAGSAVLTGLLARHDDGEVQLRLALVVRLGGGRLLRLRRRRELGGRELDVALALAGAVLVQALEVTLALAVLLRDDRQGEDGPARRVLLGRRSRGRLLLRGRRRRVLRLVGLRVLLVLRLLRVLRRLRLLRRLGLLELRRLVALG